MDGMISTLNEYVWSSGLIGLCLVAGLYFSIASRFLQVRHIKHMLQLLLENKPSAQGVSSFQALALSISGRVGVGNIAGVATAIAYGGPGAVFWMWTIAFFGAATAFVESALAQMYKVEQDGQYRGGPAYYIEKALGWKWYAVSFAVATLLAVGFFLPGVQGNAIAASMQSAFALPPAWTGAGLCVIMGLIIFGGVKRISHVAELVVPFMAVAYIVIAVAIVAMNIERLPGVIQLILSSAFGVHATFGGVLGAAISWGVKRGVYSNEAGQGSGPHAAAAAEVSHPAKQGLVQAFSIYIDTLFVCSATAFMILLAGTYNVYDGQAAILDNLGSVEVGSLYTQLAIDGTFAGLGAPLVAVAIFFFAFTTIMAYYYIAETNLAYLMRGGNNVWIVNGLRLLLLSSVFYGSVRTASSAWALGDLGVGIMAWLNIIAILILRKPGLAILRDYERQRKAGKDPVFHPEQFGITREDGVWCREQEQASVLAKVTS